MNNGTCGRFSSSFCAIARAYRSGSQSDRVSSKEGYGRLQLGARRHASRHSSLSSFLDKSGRLRHIQKTVKPKQDNDTTLPSKTQTDYKRPSGRHSKTLPFKIRTIYGRPAERHDIRLSCSERIATIHQEELVLSEQRVKRSKADIICSYNCDDSGNLYIPGTCTESNTSIKVT